MFPPAAATSPRVLSLVLALALVLGAMLARPAPALAVSDAEVRALVQEVKALRKRVAELEKKVAGACEVQATQGRQVSEVQARAEEAWTMAQEARQRAAQAFTHAREASTRSVKASRDVEVATEERPAMVSELGKRLSIHGQLQVEATHERRERPDGRSTSNSDLALATAEIFFAGDINKYARGVIHLLYEEGKTTPMDLDEAFLLIGQTGDMPFYLLGGRIYPAVGLFESYMVSDTITKNLFETQEAALEVGYAGGWFNLGAGAYSGGLQEHDPDDESHINSWYARLQLTAPEGSLGGLGLTGGVAYTNNIGDAGGLLDQVPGSRVRDLVAGWSASLAASYGAFNLLGEYITAAGDFAPGELEFAGDRAARPWAFNLELAWTPAEQWVVAARYEGGGDLYQYEPERQYGLAAAWTFLPDTSLALEYLRGDYEGGGNRDLVTSQITVAY